MMDWMQVWTIIGANIGLAFIAAGTTITLFLWARAEGNADRREMKAEFEDFRRDMQSQFIILIKEVTGANRDTHGRLVKLEEKQKGG